MRSLTSFSMLPVSSAMSISSCRSEIRDDRVEPRGRPPAVPADFFASFDFSGVNSYPAIPENILPVVGALDLMVQRQSEIVHPQPDNDAENAQRLAAGVEVL